MHDSRVALPPQVVIPNVDQSAVAVLLVDPRSNTVTYANPSALDLTRNRASLPTDVQEWSAAARLGPASGARGWVDPVVQVAAGGTVSGWRVAFTADDGSTSTYWATGSQLLSGSGTPPGAMVAFFPIDARGHTSDAASVDAAVDAALQAANATQAGPHGVARADTTAGRAVGRPAMVASRGATSGGSDQEPPHGEDVEPAVLAQEAADGAASLISDSLISDDPESVINDATLITDPDLITDPSLNSDDALTARALLASSISFTISDPRQDDDPLVWVNPAFERMTGYAVDDVVGRNCRFLQGPGTDQAEVARIREALAAGETVGSELLNYRADGTAFWNSLAISPVLDGEGTLTHFVGVQTDVTARVLAGIEHDRLLAAERDARAAAERARAQLALIERVGSMLSETLNSEEALQRVVSAVVPALGDFCAVDLVEADPDGGPPQWARRVAVAHRDPEQAGFYWRLADRDRQRPETSHVPQVLRTGRSVLVPPLSEADYRTRAGGDRQTLGLLEALDVHNGAVVPLRARGRVIAVLSIGVTRAGGRTFGSEDLTLAESLAARAALAVDNARLFEAETDQRHRADALSAAGAVLAGTLRSADVVDVLIDQVVPAFADWAFVHVDGSASPSLRPPGVRTELHPVASRHADAQREAACADFLRDWPMRRDHPGPGLAWSTATAQLVRDVPAALAAVAGISVEEAGLVRGLEATSAVSVPLTARGVTVGALTVCRHGGRPFSAEELRFVDDLGRRGAMALENARLYEAQRVVALELQRSLLPDRLPSVPDLDVAGRYLAGAAGTEVGGDWYDVIQLPSRRVMVAVGDVMGRGVRAAAVMGQMRSALRSYAVEGLQPAQLLGRLAAFTRVMEGEHLVTCVVGLYDPVSGTIQLASAGHSPPLLLRADGGADLVEVEPGLPLGVPAGGLDHATDPQAELAGSGYTCTEVSLPPSAGLVLYTDGLVEDRDVPVGEGLERLQSGMDRVRAGSADDMCDIALRLMGRLDSHDDDTAVLALRVPVGVPGAVPPSGADLRRVLLADGGPPAAAASRQVVRDALADGPLRRLVDTATLLVSELVTNALRHGGGPRELVVELVSGGVTVSVSDASPSPPLQRDQWSTAVDVLPENGRGLLLVAALADDWGWAQEPLGKRVWFRLRARADEDAADRLAPQG